MSSFVSGVSYFCRHVSRLFEFDMTNMISFDTKYLLILVIFNYLFDERGEKRKKKKKKAETNAKHLIKKKKKLNIYQKRKIKRTNKKPII